LLYGREYGFFSDGALEDAFPFDRKARRQCKDLGRCGFLMKQLLFVSLLLALLTGCGVRQDEIGKQKQENQIAKV